ncbi:MAG: long-chain fatty acid--CoA ligase [Actinobacteria bacterium]|nr:long-chain fatty acid--CoA ligase [Actinomycetota bacterium]
MGEETIGAVLKSRVGKYQDKTMLRVNRDGVWREITWNEFNKNVVNIGLALISIGIEAGDRVAIFSSNSPEWQMIDIAALSIGAADVPLYSTLSAPQAKYILKDSGSRVVFVGTRDHLDRILEVRDGLPDLLKIVTIDNTVSDHPDVITLDDVLKLGEKNANREQFDKRLESTKPGDLCSIVYTSGTTGDPKGVMLTHDNFLSNVRAASKLVEIGPEDDCLSFLPLSHVLERMSGYYTSMYNGVPMAHARSIDDLVEDIGVIKPTYMVSVPRLYEKVHAGVLANVEEEPAIKQKIFHWAVGVGTKVSALTVNHKPVPFFLGIKNKVANKLVFSKIYEKMGGRLRFFVSGGAPLAKEIAEFFHAMGILILEGYGLTETSPVITVNTPEAIRFGSVGRAIEYVEVKIDDNGEIMAKGPNIMQGYYNKPEATAEVLHDGWFRTGDVGRIDEDGFLFITDRIKDIIVTAGGKNIAPQNLENTLKLDKYIDQVCVLGDKKKFISALIVPNFDELKSWAKEKGLQVGSVSYLINNEDVINFYRERIDLALKDFAKFEQVTKFTLLPKELTEEAGLVTPTLKVKRREVEKKFAAEIDKMYTD